MVRLVVLMLVVASASARVHAGTREIQPSDSLPPYSISDPNSPVVSEASLLESERFWPYQVALTSAQPSFDGRGPLAVGSLGVLIRVEPGYRARIDFGRDGLVTLPVHQTDLIARANDVRTGKTAKAAPNLAFAIGPRLLDAKGEVPTRIPFASSIDRAGFVALFVDPATPSFTKLAGALAPLATKDGVLSVLFPQGAYPDDKILPRLRAAGWQGAYVMDHLSEAYTHTLIDGDVTVSTLALYSAEGRTLWSGEFTGDLSPEFWLAWKRAFGG